MKQFIVIDQLRLNEKGALVCKKPSGRLCSKVHFKQGDLDGVCGAYSLAMVFNMQGDLDGVCGAYSLAMVFNILGVFEDSSRNSDEHGNRAAEWKMIRSLNNQDLYPNGLKPCDMIKMVTQTYSKYVTIDHTGRKAGIPLKVKECIDKNAPVILQISCNQDETHWIVVVGYVIDEGNEMRYLLTLDSRKDLRIGHFWNGILNLDRCTRLKYGFQYVTDTEEWVGLDDAIIIKKK